MWQVTLLSVINVYDGIIALASKLISIVSTLMNSTSALTALNGIQLSRTNPIVTKWIHTHSYISMIWLRFWESMRKHWVWNCWRSSRNSQWNVRSTFIKVSETTIWKLNSKQWCSKWLLPRVSILRNLLKWTIPFSNRLPGNTISNPKSKRSIIQPLSNNCFYSLKIYPRGKQEETTPSPLLSNSTRTYKVTNTTLHA
jgi:hypothetical protein